MPIYATKATIGAIKCTKSVGNIDDELFHPIEAGVDFTIGDIEFEPLHISHDAADPVAYRFKNENHAMAVVTDLGTYDRCKSPSGFSSGKAKQNPGERIAISRRATPCH